jgi:hypothetical protein
MLVKRLVTAQVLRIVLITSAVVVAPWTATSSQARGEGVGVRPPTGRGDVEAVAPPGPTRAPEDRDYPGGVRSMHDPVFIEPMTATVGPTRIGLSAWTAPGVPFQIHEAPGGAAVGLTIAWPAAGGDAGARRPRL